MTTLSDLLGAPPYPLLHGDALGEHGPSPSIERRLMAQAMEAQLRKDINGLFLPKSEDDPPATTCTSGEQDLPSFDLEQFQETMKAMTVMPPQIRIIESELCTVSEERPRKRMWRERLLGRPWRPWQAMAVETVQVPDPNLFTFDVPQSVMGGGVRTERVVVGHPATVKVLREELAE